MAGTFCPKCARSNPVGVEKCQFCGSLLDAKSAFTPATPAEQSQPPFPQDDSNASADLPDWLSGLGKDGSEEEREVPEWLTRLGGDETGSAAPAPTTAAPIDLPGREEPPPDQDGMKSTQAVSTAPLSLADLPGKSGIPDWLSGSKPAPQEEQPAPSPAKKFPDDPLLLKGKTINLGPLPGVNEGPGSDIPDWLSNFGSIPGTPEAATGESVPEWLSALEAKTGADSTASVPIFNIDKTPSTPASEDSINWLSQFQADINAAHEQETKPEQFEPAPTLPVKRFGTGPLPEWLTGIKRTSTAPKEAPALITTDEGVAPPEKDSSAFSLDIPDWLSKLQPEQSTEYSPEGVADTSVPEDIQVTDLPTWVQAMRPVEAVVAETAAIENELNQVTEQSGPLAGLRGVLPHGPGIGQLRKPPAYSSILQVSEGQQRYAAAFEKLISGETEPQVLKKSRLTSNRLWRWLIAAVLILAVGLPLSISMQVAPASTLKMPEMVNAFTLIGNLSPNAPVLVVFDYDPALCGELEAAAAPLMDHLLLQGPRLALIATSPTGPALAERLLHDASASPLVAVHNYQAWQQYVNLGYLAGGSSGVLYFSLSPVQAAPFTIDRQLAWQSPALQGVQKLSDFQAVIILTDNAESGRVWIEQSGAMIGTTPILMVISAQVEPMILPYYDSGQIKGLVTGLAGGEAYGQTFSGADAQTGLAQRYWNSFSAGTLAAEILIVLGALWSAFISWRASLAGNGAGA
jgi:hypothetical protein